ncbi:MAG: rhodanese-like domain-containing protein [Acidimicrobiales bacterium]
MAVSRVTSVPAADPVAAAEHFARRLAHETDPSDVQHDLAEGLGGFVVVDTRSPEAYARAHIPGAVNLPHRDMTSATVAEVLPDGAVAVTYCWGPHCNAATKGALALGRLGRPVKEMAGGIEGWEKDGYTLVAGPHPGAFTDRDGG